MAKMAQDTFVAQLADGGDMLVVKGQVLADGHELVKRDAKGSGTLFRALDLGDDDPPPVKKADPKPEPKAAG
jgi:hypothetical protein